MKIPLSPISMNKTEAAKSLNVDRALLNEYIKLGLLKTHFLPGKKNPQISKKQIELLVERAESYGGMDKILFNAYAILTDYHKKKFKRTA